MRCVALAAVIITAASCTGSSGVAAMSASKISVHSGGMQPVTTQFLHQAQPRLIKILDAFGDTGARMKAIVPGIVTVGRIYHDAQPEDGDPKQRANEWWSQNKGTIMSSKGIDYWEGYNEPGCGDVSTVQWLAQFEIERVSLLAANGAKASVGNFGTGSPDITHPEVAKAFLPAIAAAKAHGGILGLHEYNSPQLANCFDNSTGEGWMTGRYRKWYRQQLIPANLTIPLVISEFGIDNSPCGGSPNSGGWHKYCAWWASKYGIGNTQDDCAAFYVDQISWYDRMIREDEFVIGATIYSLEIAGNWAPYDVAAAVPQLIRYMNGTGPPTPAPPGPPPTPAPPGPPPPAPPPPPSPPPPSPSSPTSFRNIIGLHLGPGGDHDNVETYLRQLDAARVPFSIKDVNEWGPELELAAKLRAASGVDHTIIWRHTDTDVPPYHLAPSAAAVQHWSLVKSKMPPGLMPYKEQVWLEVVNEPDMNQCAWMANFSIAVSKLAVSDGWRLFNFGWSTGNPHVGAGGGPDCYEDPATLDFLRYASQQGGKVGVALHEYSNSMNITNEWPYLLGRLHFLFDACDKHDIPRPLAAITEWGWLGCNVKLPAQAGVADIDQVMRGMGAGSYHAFAPQLKAAMMWYLGPWSCPISTQADQLVLPIMNYTLSTYTP